MSDTTLSKDDLTNLALDGEFSEGEQRFILEMNNQKRVVRVFDNGESLMVQEIWHQEPMGNDCYLDSYPNDSKFINTDFNNSSELICDS